MPTDGETQGSFGFTPEPTAPTPLPAPTKKTRAKRVPPTDGSLDDSYTGNRESPHVPKDWLTQPIFRLFPTGKPMDPIELKVGGHVWYFGVSNPLTHEPSRELTLDHAGVLFTILGVFQEKQSQQLDFCVTDDSVPSANISLTDIARRVSTYNSGVFMEQLRNVIDDLRNAYFAFEQLVPKLDRNKQPVLSAGVPVMRKHITTFSLLHGYGVRKIYALGSDKLDADEQPLSSVGEPVTHAEWLDRLTLHPIMLQFANGLVRIVQFKVGAYRKITSDIARAIYLFIPSRAAHATSERPWRISLLKLLCQIGHPGVRWNDDTKKYDVLSPSLKTPSERKRLFTQNGSVIPETDIDGRHSRSIIAQLDGAAMMLGHFHCRIERNANDTDWLFVCWKEARDASAKDPHKLTVYDGSQPGALQNAWVSAGRDVATFRTRIAKLPNFSDYETESFEQASIDLRTSKNFFQMAKALLGETHFDSLLREAVAEMTTTNDTNTPQNPTGLLISRVIAAAGGSTHKQPSASPVPATNSQREPSQPRIEAIVSEPKPTAVFTTTEPNPIWQVLSTADREAVVKLAYAQEPFLREFTAEELLESPVFLHGLPRYVAALKR